MFLDKKDQKMKEEMLKELLNDISEMDDGKGERFGKKPMAAELSITEVMPKGEGEGDEEMDDSEESDMSMGEDMKMGSSPSPDDILKIKELYNKYCC